MIRTNCQVKDHFLGKHIGMQKKEVANKLVSGQMIVTGFEMLGFFFFFLGTDPCVQNRQTCVWILSNFFDIFAFDFLVKISSFFFGAAYCRVLD